MQEPTETTQQILIEPEHTLPDFTFDQLPEGMRGPIAALGWKTPMPVQAKAVPYLLDRRDMIVQSRTGSGKTGAFLIPLLMRIDPSRRHPQALVLVPTRELAGQVFKEFETLSRDMNISGVLVYGGVGYGAQLQALREGAQVVIGTPGRVLDHIGRRSLNFDRLQVLVFDEADEMLSMGFYPDMREIRRYLPRERSSWMFSATMPYKVQMLAREFLRDPEFLSLSAGNVSVSAAEHRYYEVEPLEKDLMLMRLIEFEHPESAIIFCNTKIDVEYLATVLGNYGYNADLLSGDLDQKSRERAMERIRNGETRFLVATDVAARGIDISDLSHVFQYDVPKDTESYIHRAGRTARAGNTGVVITLVANMSEKSDLKKIARKYAVEFVEMPMPTQTELEERMAERMIVILDDRLRKATRLQRERMKRFSTVVQMLAGNDEEQILLAMLIDEIYHTTYHQPAPVEPTHEARRESRSEERREPRSDDRRESRSEERREPRSDDRRESRSDDRRESRSDDRQRNEPRREESRSAPQNQDAAAVPVGDGDAERKKKKRRRKKKKNRGDGMTPREEGGVHAEEGSQPEAPSQEAPSAPAVMETPDEPARTPDRPQPERSQGDRPRDERPRGRRGDRGQSEPTTERVPEQLWFDSIEVIEPDSPAPSPEPSGPPRSTRRDRAADVPAAASPSEPPADTESAAADETRRPARSSSRRAASAEAETPAAEAPAAEVPAAEAPAKRVRKAAAAPAAAETSSSESEAEAPAKSKAAKGGTTKSGAAKRGAAKPAAAEGDAPDAEAAGEPRPRAGRAKKGGA